MDGSQDHHPLLRRHNTKRSYSTMADSHRDHEPSSSLFLSPDGHYDNEQSTHRRRLALPPLAANNMRPAHYPGDGLDFRRPVMSSVTSAAPVIDLTDDDHAQDTDSQGTSADAVTATATSGGSRARRLPRFGRDVIDIAGAEDEEESAPPARRLRLHVGAPPQATRPQFSGLRRPARFRQPTPPADMDDELEIVSERPLSRPQTASGRHTPAILNQRSITPYPADLHQPIDLTNDDDVVITNTRPREGGINAERPGTTAGVGTRSDATYRGFGGVGHIADILRGEGANLGGRLMQRLGYVAGFDGELRAQAQAMAQFEHNHNFNQHHGHHQHHHHNHHNYEGRRIGPGADFAAAMGVRTGLGPMPGMHLDFDTVGFDMGIAGGNRPPTPKYSPPPEPEPGFTRNPAEDEMVVCPNCGDELAMGEDEVKQQVWVVKGCGHAYCGGCAHNRNRAVSKKGKGKATDASLPSPFKKCVVDGCGKTTSKSHMFQVYLGS